MPSSGSCLALASRFSKRSVSRESIQPDCRLHRCLRHQVSLLTLCPLGQPKKAIGRESEIEPWLTHAQRNRLACPRFRKSIGVHICFPSSAMVSERSSPSRVRFAAPNGAPLTAPGRSEERIPSRGKGREYKPAAASASRWSALTTLRPGQKLGRSCRDRHLPASRGEAGHALLRHNAPGKSAWVGLNAETNPRRTSARGRSIFS